MCELIQGGSSNATIPREENKLHEMLVATQLLSPNPIGLFIKGIIVIIDTRRVYECYDFVYPRWRGQI